MTIERIKKLNWLNIASMLWGATGTLCICPALTVILFFDSPSPNWSANYFFIFSVISFPVVCIISSLGIWFLKKKHKKLAVYVILIPVLPLILIYAGNSWMSFSSCGKFDCSIPTMQEQGNTTNASECALPALEGEDSLDTTGCGVLKVGVLVTGVTSSATESHNWQFSAQKGAQMTITIESSESCPQISVLDLGGDVVESFKDENKIRVCPRDMTTTSFFYFDPPANGVYTLRLITPETPGAYWLKIE